jgi:glycosyltransferase involved in cell wall biosynthesis
LERSLASLAMQQKMAGRFEVVVVDDGSKDRTHDVVHEFARQVDFPVKLTTHPHEGFRISLCRNDGIRVSVGSYVLISDSDCLFPPDHLSQHLRARKPGVARAGNCYWLDQATTERLTIEDVSNGTYGRGLSFAQHIRMWRRWASDVRYQLHRHPSKPKLLGFNIAIAREDLEAVNGFDEEYVGWGCEDDDFAARLRMAGRQIRSVIHYTRGYHMWHPAAASHPGKWGRGANVERWLNSERAIRCRRGLVHLADQTENQDQAA